MKDKTMIAIILLTIVGLMQLTSFALGHNGQVLIITSNIFTGVLAFYFGKETIKSK